MDLSKISNSDLLAELRRRNYILGSPFTSLDVDNLSSNMGYFPTHDDIEEIIESINRTFDASVGINWEVIEYHITEYFSAK